MTETVETVTIEIRARLGTATIFIKFTPQTDSTTIKVQLESENIILHFPNSEQFVLKTPNVSFENISNYEAKDNFIHFRTRLKSSSTDWFLVPNESRTASAYRCTSLTDVQLPWLRAHKEYSVECRGCTCVLAKDVVFQHVLPIWEETSFDFFCHVHSEEQKNNPELKPPDCRFGQCFWLIPISKFSSLKQIVKGRSCVACNRCKRKLGTSTSDDQYKLWNSTVQWSIGEKRELVTSEDDFLLNIEDAMKKSVGIVTKICIEAEGTETKSYLLLWVIERELPLLYSNFKTSLDMKHKTVVKLLYLLQNSQSNMVKSWQDVDCVLKITLLEDIFVSGVQLLIRNASGIPKSLKMSGGFYVSYLPKL